MASVINTNIMATRTHNVYSRNNDYMNAAMTRVATGMKINSAKDGASTWAISEKMRERIRANDQANQNVQNDQALLKTAQGGIGNTIDILKTLKERAINAANDSNTNADRARIATEVDQLIKQIDENVEKVKFNGKLLLDGTYADPTETKFEAKPEPGAVTGVSAATNVATSDGAEASGSRFESANAFLYTGWQEAVSTGNTNAATSNTKLVKLLNVTTQTASSNINDSDYMFQKGDVITLSFTADGEAKENSVTVDKNTTIGNLISGLSGNGVTVVWDSNSNNITGLFTSTDGALNSTAISNTANKFTVHSTTMGTSATSTGTLIDNLQLSISGDAGDRDFSTFITKLGDFEGKNYAYKPEEDEATAAGLTFYVGGESGFATNVGINAMKASDLGVSSLANSMLEKGTAEKAIKTIDDALAKALNEQTKLGSWESRLGYTSDNLTTMNENLEAADSVMRDSDIAKDMTSYMKYAVLSQASQYMLAQAGQNAFQVLNLLQQ